MEERFRIDGPRFEIARGTKDYPDVFEAVPEPPERLYVIGDPSALKEGLAVVGARKATPYGLNATKMLAGRAAELGVVVISGGARGCDAAAHEAALAAGGQTVAFLGGGCDEPYPKSNVDAFRRIVKGGGVVASEFPWHYPPKPFMFRKRNRLMRGWRVRRLSWRRGFPAVHSLRPTRPLPPIKTCFAVPGSIFFRHIGGLEYVACAGGYAHREQGSVRFGDYVVVSRKSWEAGMAPNSWRCSRAMGPMRGRRPYSLGPCGRPMRLEEIIALFADGDDPMAAATRVMAHVSLLEGAGALTRFPDGRFGAVG